MKGLLLDGFYAALGNERVFGGIMLAAGVAVVAVDNRVPTLLMGYVLLCIMGFALCAMASMRRGCASKWFRYKLTTPVRRRDIAVSGMLGQLAWLGVGLTLAALVMALSIRLHGDPFSDTTDGMMLFVMGVSVSLTADAVFYPLFYRWGEEKNEVILVVSLLTAICAMLAVVSLINRFFGSPMTLRQVMLGAAIMLAVASGAFVLSIPLSVRTLVQRQF